MHAMISQRTAVKTNNSTQLSCWRCSGCMVHEMCMDLQSDSGRCTFWALRCLQCGDMVDEVILRNRSLSHPEMLCVAAA